MAILVGYVDSISIYRIQLQNKHFKTIRAALCTFLPTGLHTGLPTSLPSSEPPSEPRYDLRPKRNTNRATIVEPDLDSPYIDTYQAACMITTLDYLEQTHMPL